VELDFARTRVCEVLGAPRSTIYAREAAAVSDPEGVVITFPRRGPRTQISDEELLVLTRKVIIDSPFAGEAYRKVTARLRREHGVSCRTQARPAPYAGGGTARPAAGQETAEGPSARRHDHPRGPDVLWGTDATMVFTKRDGWVWAFCCVDHFTAEAWTTVAKRGDRLACLEPIYDAVTDRFGKVDGDLARGIALRHDWGPQYISGHFQGRHRMARE
jgi:putative transposase